MSPVRVLIVDDSIVVRRLLTEILTAEADIEIVGSAGSASTAMSKLEQLKPDIVTLDVEMPGVSGLELLDQIRAKNPRIPVIMFSALTYRAGATTLEALARGATDYVTKPSGTDRAEAAEHVRRELAPRLRALGSKRESRFMPAVRPSAAPVSTAQFAPVFAIASFDFDADGKKDLFLGGNMQHVRIRFGKSDANYGTLLKGDGHGSFTYISQRESGLSIRGDVRDAFVMHTPAGDFLTITVNQQPLQMYRIGEK